MAGDEDDDRIAEDRLYRLKQVARLEGCCLATVYVRLGDGEYIAHKDGKLTLIPGSSILERRRKMLRPAIIKQAR